ncbi:hypothetical protein BJ508DRAFT_161876 [Ascobolus immersus RN42]|uniref:Uncharacterized protein n=1 Tax=Ascobolus immersus RN42 TaxID=1160509 RepID=A0A3N4HY53_ASCIM|nr:hypothetical protein BJ508DRAFT_161876 [Ascobolus immersus RN42]
MMPQEPDPYTFTLRDHHRDFRASNPSGYHLYNHSASTAAHLQQSDQSFNVFGFYDSEMHTGSQPIHHSSSHEAVPCIGQCNRSRFDVVPDAIAWQPQPCSSHCYYSHWSATCRMRPNASNMLPNMEMVAPVVPNSDFGRTRTTFDSDYHEPIHNVAPTPINTYSNYKQLLESSKNCCFIPDCNRFSEPFTVPC